MKLNVNVVLGFQNIIAIIISFISKKYSFHEFSFENEL